MWDIDTYTGQYKWKPYDNDLIDLKIGLWKTDTHFDLNRAYPIWDLQPLFPDAWILKTASSVDADRWGVNVSNASVFDTSLGGLALQYGVSFIEESMLQYNTGEELPELGSPAYYEPGKAGDRKEWSAFVSSAWTPFDWLKIENALRYTRTKSHDDCLRFPDHCHEDLDNDGFAPIAAVTVEPWQGIQAYVRYAEAICSPSLYEATSGESFDLATWFSLVPEHARNWEAGANVLRENVLTDGDKLRFKAAYFDNNIEDYITRNFGDVPALFVMRNIDHARFKGAELSVDYDAGRYFGSLDYTHYFETEFCLTEEQWEEDSHNAGSPRCSEGGVQGGYVQMHVPPKDMVTLILGARFFEETLEVGSRVSYFGERPKDMAGDSGFTFIPGWEPYTVVDLFASWKINENVTAEFNVDNLTDQYYIDALSISLKPAPGRAFRAGLTAKF